MNCVFVYVYLYIIHPRADICTSEISDTMDAASLKEPSSSLDSTLPFPEEKHILQSIQIFC